MDVISDRLLLIRTLPHTQIKKCHNVSASQECRSPAPGFQKAASHDTCDQNTRQHVCAYHKMQQCM